MLLKDLSVDLNVVAVTITQGPHFFSISGNFRPIRLDAACVSSQFCLPSIHRSPVNIGFQLPCADHRAVLFDLRPKQLQRQPSNIRLSNFGLDSLRVEFHLQLLDLDLGFQLIDQRAIDINLQALGFQFHFDRLDFLQGSAHLHFINLCVCLVTRNVRVVACDSCVVRLDAGFHHCLAILKRKLCLGDNKLLLLQFHLHGQRPVLTDLLNGVFQKCRFPVSRLLSYFVGGQHVGVMGLLIGPHIGGRRHQRPQESPPCRDPVNGLLNPQRFGVCPRPPPVVNRCFYFGIPGRSIAVCDRRQMRIQRRHLRVITGESLVKPSINICLGHRFAVANGRCQGVFVIIRAGRFALKHRPVIDVGGQRYGCIPVVGRNG